MPFQNRVDPFGALISTPARGTLTGNRGCLHDDQACTVRVYEVPRWIICVLDFAAPTHAIMTPGFYTHLFFLDEATALAAGHRTCARCQRPKFNDFRAHWIAANPEFVGGTPPDADTIDAILHRERISDHHYQRDKMKLTYTDHLDHLPDGTFVVLEASDAPHMVLGDALFPWSFEGYGQPIARATATVQVVTPRSTVRALAHGYQPTIHSSMHAPLSRSGKRL